MVEEGVALVVGEAAAVGVTMEAAVVAVGIGISSRADRIP
jgi:hypothetical protein